VVLVGPYPTGPTNHKWTVYLRRPYKYANSTSPPRERVRVTRLSPPFLGGEMLVYEPPT
jgi:hypothetical protein